MADLENTRRAAVVGDNTFETKVTQRLRSLEANRPIEISNRDAAAIARDIRKVNDHLERVVERLNPPF